jgi:hypothetical protein
MGIRDKPIAAGSPWPNGYVERLIGTILRECLDEQKLKMDDDFDRAAGRAHRKTKFVWFMELEP